MGQFSPFIWDHLYFLLVGVLLPVLALKRDTQDMSSIDFDKTLKIRVYYGNSFILWIGAGIALLIWWICDRSFGDLGFRGPILNKYSVGLSLLLLAVYMLDVMFETKIPERLKKTRENWRKYTPFMPSSWTEMAHFSFLAFSAGFCEEVIFRGFLINYLLFFLGDSLLGIIIAVVLPAAIFAISHLYQGKKAVVKILLLAISLGVLFLVSQSLWLVISLHVAIDLAGGLIGMYLIQRGE